MALLKAVVPVILGMAITAFTALAVWAQAQEASGLPPATESPGPLMRLPNGEIVVAPSQPATEAAPPASPSPASPSARPSRPVRPAAKPTTTAQGTPSTATGSSGSGEAAQTAGRQASQSDSNRIITSQIANAPLWAAGAAYRTDYQSAQAITVASVGSGCMDNDILTMRGGTGIGAAKFQITVRGGGVTVSAIGPAGAYAAPPSNPVSVTGGRCHGTTFNATWVSKPSRVVSGDALSQTSLTTGKPLYLWEAVSSGTSGTVKPNISESCAASTSVSDGGVRWKCLTRVDYHDISTYLYDNARWQANHQYYYYEQIRNGSSPARNYIIRENSISPPRACTSGNSGGPTGTSGDIVDGTCRWTYLGDLGYSSEVSFIPTEAVIPGGSYQASRVHNYYVGVIWYGGAAQQEYVPGSNGEWATIMPSNHTSNSIGPYLGGGGEAHPVCFDDPSKLAPSTSVPNNSCAGTIVQYPEAFGANYGITLEGSSLDRFNANPAVRTSPLIYNSANGVAIHATGATGGQSAGMHVGNAIDAGYDNSNHYAYLQVKADHGAAVDGEHNGNGYGVSDSLLDGVGWCPGNPCDHPFVVDGVGGPRFLNNVIIARGTMFQAISAKYVPTIVNNTIVSLSGDSKFCIGVYSQWPNGGVNQITKNNYCAGFLYETYLDSFFHLTADVDASTTSIPIDAKGFPFSVDSYFQVGAEKMLANPYANPTTVTRGVGGTTPARHSKRDVFANTWNPATPASNNALSSAPITTIVAVPGGNWGASGQREATVSLPGVGRTCGAGNAETCYGLDPTHQFISPTSDFRLKPTAALIGAGTSVTIGTAGWSNSLDIAGQSRAARQDIGAIQAAGLPSPAQESGRQPKRR